MYRPHMRSAILIAVLAACGSHHAQKDAAIGSDSNGVTCVVDNDCTTAPGERCCSNVCVETADCSFSVLGVAPAEGFLNGGTWVVLSGTGFAPGMKVFIADGRAPLRVDGPTTALVLTPPGPLGLQDVKIELAGQ